MLFQARGDIFNQIFLLKLDRRKIDGNRNDHAKIRPFTRLTDGFVDDPASNLRDQPAMFGD